MPKYTWQSIINSIFSLVYTFFVYDYVYVFMFIFYICAGYIYIANLYLVPIK